MSIKITLFLNTIPYPANHGAKVDIWRRIVMMHKLGYVLQLICWSVEELSSKNKQKIEAVCNQLVIIPIYKSFWRKYKKAFLSLYYSFYPAEISVYTDYPKLEKAIVAFQPDFLWLESYAPALPALKMSKKLSIPLFYRSHNIEHYYAKMITAFISKPQTKEKIYSWFISCNLEHFEKKLIQQSQVVYDISIDDLQFWKTLYPNKKIIWLPPFATHSNQNTSHTQKKAIDFLFIGNLYTKNNIAALKWMLLEVMPIVHKKLPNTVFHIVGSNPSETFLSYLGSFDYVKTAINVDSIEPYLKNTRIIVNPALKGSGITIKTIDGLQSSTIWVGTQQAFKGLPEAFYEILHPAENAPTMAQQMIYFYTHPDQYPFSKVSTLCNHYFHQLPQQILKHLPKHIKKDSLCKQ